MTVPGFGGSEDNLLNVNGTVDADSGAVTLEMDGEAVESLIADALAAAREESASPVVTLDLSETEQARAAVLGAEAIRAFENAGITLIIKLPAAEITLPPEALEALTLDTADAVSIKIEAAAVPASKLTPMQAVQVRGFGAVVDVSVFADGKEIDVPMTISLPYQLKYGENPAAVCCWHLDDEGNLTRLNGVYDASTGVISAEINHQSYYVVGYDPVALWENALGDVSAGDWYYDAVAFANYYGLMGGYGSGAFVPDDTVTRAMFITILWNLEGKPRDQRTENREQLKDVGDSDWYAEAAVWGIENGIIFPVTDGVFAPNAPIYRQDMAVVFANYANYKGYALPRLRLVTGFTDREQISAWADEAALRLVEAGVMDRDGGGFAPHNTATRAELARMIKNLLTRTEIKKGSEPR
jgi:hypothetical protein